MSRSVENPATWPDRGPRPSAEAIPAAAPQQFGSSRGLDECNNLEDQLRLSQFLFWMLEAEVGKHVAATPLKRQGLSLCHDSAPWCPWIARACLSRSHASGTWGFTCSKNASMLSESGTFSASRNSGSGSGFPPLSRQIAAVSSLSERARGSPSGLGQSLTGPSWLWPRSRAHTCAQNIDRRECGLWD